MTIESGIENAGKGIWDLNDSYPEFDDALSEADDHLRGIKNCIKNTFPYITAAVQLTAAEINRGSVPVGSITTFYQAAAPSGWTRTTLPTYQYLMRIVQDSAAGGGSGGTDNPVLNNKVPSHTHAVTGNTSQHAGHTHSYIGTPVAVSSGAGLSVIRATGSLATSSDGIHTHSISLTSDANASADSWEPRYLDFILCTRSAITNP